MFFNLSSSQADRMSFDEHCERYVETCIEAVENDSKVMSRSLEAWGKVVDDYYGDGFETDDEEEARSRFDDAFWNVLRRKLVEHFGNVAYAGDKGDPMWIMTFDAGLKDGFAFDDEGIEAVILDDNTLAFRYNSNTQNYDWKVGTVAEAFDEAETWYQETLAAQKEQEDYYKELRSAEQEARNEYFGR